MKQRLRRFRFLVLAAAVLAAALAQGPRAHANCGPTNSPGVFAFETITVSTVSIGFTAATYAPSGQDQASAALISLETNPIRFRSDGTDPTAAVGHPAVAGQTIEVCGAPNVRKFRMIRSGAADGSATVSYFR